MTVCTNEPARVDKSELEGFLNRIERLQDEKALKAREINEQIKQVRAEAKSAGYDGPVLDLMLRIRKQDDHQRAVIGFYADVLGVFG